MHDLYDFDKEMLQLFIDFEYTYKRPHEELLNASPVMGFAYISNLDERTISGSLFRNRLRFLRGDKIEKHERKMINASLTDFTNEKRKMKSITKSYNQFLQEIG